MLTKVLPIIKDFYFLPVLITVPTHAVSGIYEEYIKNKNEPFIHHTVCCLIGGSTGVAVGAFLGAVWPISVPIFIGRYIDKNKK
jgi:hypothetical protein